MAGSLTCIIRKEDGIESKADIKSRFGFDLDYLPRKALIASHLDFGLLSVWIEMARNPLLAVEDKMEIQDLTCLSNLSFLLSSILRVN